MNHEQQAYNKLGEAEVTVATKLNQSAQGEVLSLVSLYKRDKKNNKNNNAVDVLYLTIADRY